MRRAVGMVRKILIRQSNKITPIRNLFTAILSNFEIKYERAKVAQPPIIRQIPKYHTLSKMPTSPLIMNYRREDEPVNKI